MWQKSFSKRGWALSFCGRHPLFVAAVVVAGFALAADRGRFIGLMLAALLGLAAGWLKGWRVGMAWMVVGWLGAGFFIWRAESQKSAEGNLSSAIGGEMQGRVLADAKGSGNSWKAPAVLLTPGHAGKKVWWGGRGKAPVAGSVVMAFGNFGPLLPPRNPGEFDHAAWLRSQGIVAVFHAGRANHRIITGEWAAFGAKLRRGFRTAVTAGLAEDSRAAIVIRAVVIGEQPPDAEELVAAFRNSGTLHAFSVSGLHVAMVGSIGWMLLRLVGVPRRWAIIALLVLVFSYSWLTGNSAPAVRSVWMAAVFLGAFVVRRRPDFLNSLGATLLAVLLWDGQLIFQPGVQLSYGVVAAIAFGADRATRVFSWIARPPLYLPQPLLTRWQKAWLRFRQNLAQSLGVSLAAGIGSMPLTVYHFGMITPISVLAGVILVPLVFILLSASLLAAVLFPVLPPAAQWVNRANAYVANACILTAEGFAAIPGGHFQWSLSRRPLLLVYDLDHGAGAACFSGGQGGAVLIDCADRYSFKRRIAPSLMRLGIAPDAVVLSHPDGGHLGGGSPVWETFPIRQVVLPVERSRSPGFRSWLNGAPLAGIKTWHAADLPEMQLPDGARLEILHVPGPQTQNAGADERVVIYRLHWHGWKLLFTSDAGIGTESEILAAHTDVAADVIIAGRHHSDPSLGDAFLHAVHPQVIIASHSDFPAAERLKPETVAFWQSRGIHVIHQGESGGVSISVDDTGNLKIEGFVDHSVKVLSRH
jgi:ComEC/Rec2-related protein